MTPMGMSEGRELWRIHLFNRNTPLSMQTGLYIFRGFRVDVLVKKREKSAFVATDRQK